MVKEMTVQQYADARGIWPDAVRKAIKLGHNLPGVKSRSKFGKMHVLYVEAGFLKKNKKEQKKIV